MFDDARHVCRAILASIAEPMQYFKDADGPKTSAGVSRPGVCGQVRKNIELVASTPSPNTLITLYWDLIENAAEKCDAARICAERGWFGLAQTLAVTALEELSKASDIAEWYFAVARTDEYDLIAMLKRWARHEYKLVTAQMADDQRRILGSGVQPNLPQSIDELTSQAVAYFEHVSSGVRSKHAARMSGLYVDVDGDVIRKPSMVSKEDAADLLRQAEESMQSLRLKPVPRQLPPGFPALA